MELTKETIKANLDAIQTRLKRAETYGDNWLYSQLNGEVETSEDEWELISYNTIFESCWVMLIDLLQRLNHAKLLEFALADYNEGIKDLSHSEMGYEEPFLTWPPRVQRIVSILRDIHLPEDDSTHEATSKDVQHLELLIRNSEYYITKADTFQWVPCNEDDVHNRLEGLLKCTYPDLRSKPPLAKPIKSFIPDTGIPNLKAFVEYKYVQTKLDAKAILDQILADIGGYKSDEYERGIFVIYETTRVFHEYDWKEAVAAAKPTIGIEIIALKGTPPSKKDQELADAARTRRKETPARAVKNLLQQQKRRQQRNEFHQKLLKNQSQQALVNNRLHKHMSALSQNIVSKVWNYPPSLYELWRTGAHMPKNASVNSFASPSYESQCYQTHSLGN
jgi:hypothetical protein